jgi:hypothetical protein
MNSPAIRSLNDLIDAADVARQALVRDTRDSLWWRGHACSSWQLVPRAYRPEFLGHENCLLRDFLRQAKVRYPDCPSENSWPDWLVLMQHYGLPTRLLDWSESLLVAAYFCSSEGPSQDGTIWALNPYELNASIQLGHRILDAYDDQVLGILEEAFEPDRGYTCGHTVAAQMPQNHLRQLVQQAAFTVHGPQAPIEDSQLGASVIRIEIPSSAKPTLRQSLADLGFTQSILYPDLDHLASELRFRHANRQ